MFAQPGALPETALETLIEQVRALDMDDVRKRLAEQLDQPRGRRSRVCAAAAVANHACPPPLIDMSGVRSVAPC